MNKYDVESFLRSLFESVVSAAERRRGVVVTFTSDQCQSIRDAIKYDAYLSVNLEGVFEEGSDED